MTSTRLIVGIIGLAILLPIVIFGGPAGTTAVVCIATIVALDEYARMAFPERPRQALAALVVGMAGLLLPAAAWAGAEVTLAGAGLTVVAAGIFVTLWPGEQLEDAADRLGRALVGLAWVGLMTFLIRLRSLDHGVAMLLLALGISWAADTGAYFAGRSFGRTRLYPRVSPKKTWEGLAGGVAGSMLWVLAIEAFALPTFSWATVLVMGPVASVAGVLGDLNESMLKRSHGVKDSGTILPGHGGLLDRIDSVLFVAPVVWAWHVGFPGA